MIMDIDSLYPGNMLFPMYATNGRVRYILGMKGERTIRIQFINPFYNGDVEMFMEVFTSEMLYCLCDMLVTDLLFRDGEISWEERKK